MATNKPKAIIVLDYEADNIIRNLRKEGKFNLSAWVTEQIKTQLGDEKEMLRNEYLNARKKADRYYNIAAEALKKYEEATKNDYY